MIFKDLAQCGGSTKSVTTPPPAPKKTLCQRLSELSAEEENDSPPPAFKQRIDMIFKDLAQCGGSTKSVTTPPPAPNKTLCQRLSELSLCRGAAQWLIARGVRTGDRNKVVRRDLLKSGAHVLKISDIRGAVRSRTAYIKEAGTRRKTDLSLIFDSRLLFSCMLNELSHYNL
ncbi:unnamed protein product [Microthlaspi erraticum]|uniref:Uncharacterized protein n=1 Tax=Microthlaspi erraticum TaxID=1685480 RepID=A0A6D2HKI9_9BRAS|nr:unnamed protein product [Microthlaspi erraticum]